MIRSTNLREFDPKESAGYMLDLEMKMRRMDFRDNPEKPLPQIEDRQKLFQKIQDAFSIQFNPEEESKN